MRDIMYDCYDAHKKPLGIIFAIDTKDLLHKEPRVSYVLGMDYITREAKWHHVTPDGLFPAGKYNK